MNKFLFSLFISLLSLTFAAQGQEPYEFKEFKRLPATPVKNQEQTGTCWSFSTTSFLESEVLRMGKGEHNLSEMFTVRNTYHQKCENYVRRLGKAQFGEGGLAHDNLNAVRQFGVIPESIYPGRKDPSKPLNHGKLVEKLKKMCDDYIAQAEKGALEEGWLKAIDQALDAEFGPVPVQFNYNNMVFTPVSFREYLGIKPDDYVNVTSFSHHPYWSNFILEVPDNFSNGQYLNLPLSDLMRCLNSSIQQGYTVEWDADVSNRGFSAGNGLALVPEAEWSAKSGEQVANTFKYFEPEKNVDQEYRQRMFDRLETQDDHLMHIVGIVNETHGGIFYVVKNSWGEISDYKGYVYVSEAYMRLNTISFTINKNALPANILQRGGIAPGDAVIPEPNPAATPATPPTNQRTAPSGKAGQNPKYKTLPATKLRTESKE